MNTTIDQLGKGHNRIGQYTGKNQSEPEVRLMPREDGTFLFPPTTYEDAADYANFWTNVPISDGVLSNITSGYADLIRRQKDFVDVQWAQEYDANHRKELLNGSDSGKAAARAKRATAYDTFIAGWHEDYPARIKAGTARTIARAGQLYYFATALSDVDRDTIYASTMQLGDREISVDDLTTRYQTSRIREYFQDPEVTAAERLEDLRQELRRMQGAV